MKFKPQILERINILENNLKYFTRQVKRSSLSGEQALQTIDNQLKQLQSIKDLVIAES